MKAKPADDRKHATSMTRSTLTKRTERAYRAALERLAHGKATHPKYAGRPIKITPTAVAREAGLNRNPLYTKHRALLSEIATQRATPASDLAETISRLEAKIVELHGDVRRLTTKKQLVRPKTWRCCTEHSRPKIDWHPVIVKLQS